MNRLYLIFGIQASTCNTPWAMSTLNTSQKILPFLIVPICSIIVLFYGWELYAVATERGGLAGHYYQYYQLSKGQYLVYLSGVVISFIVVAVFQMVSLRNRNSRFLTISFGIFLFFSAVLLLCDSYLMARFTGKG